MFRKTQNAAFSTQFSVLTKVLIIAGLVLSTFCLTTAEAGTTSTGITYSAGFSNPLGIEVTPAMMTVLFGSSSISVSVSHSASGTITVTGPDGFSASKTVSGLGSSTFDITLGAPGTYTVNESYNLSVTGTPAPLGDTITKTYAASAAPWTFENPAAGSTASFSVSSSIGGFAVTDTSGNVSVSVSGMSISATVTGPIPGGGSVSASVEGTWTVTSSVSVSAPPEAGTVVVTTNNADATFSLSGPDPRSGGGTATTLTGVLVGVYTLTFNQVVGFFTPAPQTKTLTVDGTITFDGVYNLIPPFGTVSVTTNNAGAAFNLTGPEAGSGSGTAQTWTDKPIGSYTLTFSPIADFITPASQTKTLIAGGTVTFSGVYLPIPETGTVTVTTNNANATFNLTGPDTRSGSGTAQTWTGVLVGTHTLTFNSVDGFITPASQTKTLALDGTISFSGEYLPIPETGTVLVITNNTSATFDLTGPSARSGNGTSQTWTSMVVGAYTLTFDPVDGFTTPEPQTKILTGNGSIMFNGQYVLAESGTGTIVVQTNLKDEATFTVTSPDYTEADFSFEDSDAHRLWTLVGASTGDHTITYGDVAGYDTPVPETLTLAKDDTITFVGNYVPLPPQIESVNVAGSPAGLGDTIIVTMSGDPGHVGTFSIEGVVDDVVMVESEPGLYTGEYVAQAGDTAEDAVVVVKLTSSSGDSTSNEDGRATIDTTPICTLPWDINKDGIVDALDIEIVSSNVGKEATPELDFNGDGVIDTLDILIVAIHFLETCDDDDGSPSAAPPASGDVPDYLFQNYPNPSNPGTWIPFMLADGNDVAVSIYSPSGQLVRRLDLGYKNSGVYVSKEQGAYWDGSNEYGEEVASGVYFYHIKAGKFSAVRKMLIAR